jgi:hypothetical protein
MTNEMPRESRSSTLRGERDARTNSTPPPYGAHIAAVEQPSDTRFRVQRSLATVHGEEIAALCMDLMPNVDTTQLSSRSDLETAVVLVRKDMDRGFSELRKDMDHEFAEVRSEMRAGFAELRKDMDHEFAEVRSEMRAGFAELRKDMDHGFNELRAEMRVGFAEQGKVLAEQISSSVNQSLRWSIVTMVSMQAVLVAAIRLL